MLELLRVQNYALIDDLELEFAPGFNVLTGETGAGKSILVEAINLVLGERASSESIRDGARQAKVDAVFRLPALTPRIKSLLRRHDLERENDSLILSRLVTVEGRSRAYVCGSLVPISVLAELGDELVDLHGQHAHQSLLKPERQLELLDGFARLDGAIESVGEMVSRLRDIDTRLGQLADDDRERTRRLEYLKHEAEEIAAANPGMDEEDQVKARRNLIQNAENIARLARHARAVLYEDDERPAIVAVDNALSDIDELARLDPRFVSHREQLNTARAAIEETAAELRAFADGLEFDPEELDRLNARLVLLAGLRRKYGKTLEEVLEYRQRALKEISEYESRDATLAQLRAEREKLHQQAATAAAALSEERQTAAKRLDKLVTAALQDLGMKEGRFVTSLETIDLGLTGIDRVEFLLTANVGEKPRPLRHVASGGEISRIMLALKAVFASADRIPTLIFDEIDAGVGGHIARKVADKLSSLAQSHQVLCITHIAQIAAAAANHFNVQKSVHKGRTTTSVQRMNPEDRVLEIARLLDGSASALSRQHARALLGQEK